MVKRMKKETDAQYWYPPKYVAKRLSLTPATITRWCRDDKFPHAKKVGRVWRIPEIDIEHL
jgi:predicted DNA-binding transcriptional regulator AlpA